MLTIRLSEQRGLADHGWLNSRHSFSFAEYFDPARMGWGNLRVLNEDRIAAGTGFGTHGHKDMEIVSVVLSGALAHRDTLGNESTIRPGEVQRMTAGTGVRHSEFNHSKDVPAHFLQVWLLPKSPGLAPGYEQKAFAADQRAGRLCQVAAPDGGQGSLTLQADARIFCGNFDAGQQATLDLAPGRLGYVQLARGSLEVNGQRLQAGDAMLLHDEPHMSLRAGRQAEVLAFDLAA